MSGNPYPDGGWDAFPNRLLDPDLFDDDPETREEDEQKSEVKE